MNVFITGGTGLLGYHLQQLAPSGLNIHTCYAPAEDPLPQTLPFLSNPLDLTDHHATSLFFSRFHPDVVIHTAAQGSLDWCEANQAAAQRINVDASLNLIDLCQRYRSHFIFLSSNAVYDGRSSFYSETDAAHPVNFYGATKLAVEGQLPLSQLDYTIIRPNLMFGWPFPGSRDNQVIRAMNSLRSSSSLKVLSDLWFSPVSAHFVSRVIWHCVVKRLTGLYNVGGAQRLNLFSLSQTAAAIFQLDASLLIPISIHDIAAAPRSADTSFSTAAMTRDLSFSPETVQVGIGRMVSIPT